MGTPTASGRALFGVALILIGGILIFAGGVTAILSFALFVAGAPLLSGYMPSLVIATQAAVMIGSGVFLFRKGRRVYDTIAG